MKFKQYLLIAPLMLATQGASANWMYLETGGAFDDKPMHIMATVNLGYSLGFRCKDKDSLELVYSTNEKFNEDEDRASLDSLNAIQPELLIRIDKNEVLSIGTQMTSMQSKVSALSAVPEDYLQQVIKAQRRISVAVKMLGQIIHEHNFSVAGSTKSGKELAKKCGLLTEVE